MGEKVRSYVLRAEPSENSEPNINVTELSRNEAVKTACVLEKAGWQVTVIALVSEKVDIS